jgi:hypothetical protein
MDREETPFEEDDGEVTANGMSNKTIKHLQVTGHSLLKYICPTGVFVRNQVYEDEQHDCM